MSAARPGGAMDAGSDAGDIAIVGMACRFPGAPDWRAYWASLLAGHDAIVEIPDERWPARAMLSDDVNAPGRTMSKWGGLIDDVAVFDHAFFGLSPREARAMDPQQRLLLQEAWRCVEDSGIPLRRLQAARTNVTIGVMALDWYRRYAGDDRLVDAYSALGNYECILANRLSHALDLRGESKSIDTACSSSLVAVADAQRALRLGDCDYAIAGGVSLILDPFRYLSFSNARMLSPGGRCKTFDASADGYVPGEGVGLVLLRRLADALRDGDLIHAVVKGASVNHNGGRRDITAPSVDAQFDVLSRAHRAARVTPAQVGYVEAHGTGTSLGDPIEMEALARWRAAGGESIDTPCGIGGVKASIGHLEAAAGIAGLLKVVLMMKHRTLVPTRNLTRHNPLIDFERAGFSPVREAAPWKPPQPGHPLVAGVSSFGFGGVNSHVVLAEAPAAATAAAPPVRARHLALSAKSLPALRALVDDWQRFCETDEGRATPPHVLEALLLTGRQPFAWRSAIRFERVADLLRALRAEADRLADGSERARPASVALRIEVGADLATLGNACERLAATRRSIDADRSAVEAFAGRFPEHIQQLVVFAKAYAVLSHLARVTRPACWQAAGAAWWVVGTVAGWIDLDEALAGFIGRREQLPLRRRGRAALFDARSGLLLSPANLAPADLARLVDRVTIPRSQVEAVWQQAAVLAVHQHSFRHFLSEWAPSGDSAGLDALGALQAHPSVADWLATGADAHLLTPMAAAMLASLRRLNRRWGLSGLGATADPATDLVLELLAEGVLSPHRFLRLLAGLADTTDTIDAGAPDAARREKLAALLAAHADALALVTDPQVLDTREPGDAGQARAQAPRPATPANEVAWSIDALGADPDADGLASLVDAWAGGVDVDWLAWFGDDLPARAALPTCVFVGRAHWLGTDGPKTPPSDPAPAARAVDIQASTPATAPVEARVPPVEARVPPRDTSLRDTGLLEATLSPDVDPVLCDHVITGHAILPGAGMLSLAVASALGNEFRPLSIEHATFMRPGVPRPVLRVTASVDGRGARFRVDADEGTLCQGRLRVLDEAVPPAIPAPSPGQALARWYESLADDGYRYGPAFRTVRHAWWDADALRAALVPCADPAWPGRQVSPGLLDGTFQCAVVALASEFGAPGPGTLRVPASVRALKLHRPLDEACVVEVARATLRRSGEACFADLRIRDAEGRLVAEIEGLMLQRVPSDFLGLPAAPRPAAPAAIRYRLDWRRMATPSTPATAPHGAAIVLAPAGPATDDLASRVQAGLRARHAQVLLERFEATEDAIAILAERLLGETASLWWIGAAPSVATSAAEVLEAARTGIDGLFLLVRALARGARPGDAHREVTALSCDAWVVAPGDGGEGWQAAGYAGLARSLRAERSPVRLRVLDVDARTLRSDELAARLAAARWPAEGDVLIAVRGSDCYAVGTRRVVDDADAHPTVAALRDGGVYLVCGGLGGIGRQLAVALSRQVACSVVLVGRTLPEPAVLHALRAAMAPSCTIEAWTSDLGDEETVAALFARIDERFGRLDGIFHAAGVLRDGLLAGKPLAAFADVQRPKVLGSWLLLRHARRLAPAFFVGFSSAVAAIGNIGQADYAAANGTLEALLSHASATGGPTRCLAVAWTLWADGGMGANDRVAAHFARLGLPAIGADAAFAALFASLADHGTIAICAAPAPAFETLLADVLPAHAAAPDAALPVIPSSSSAMSEPWIERVRRIVGDVLEVDPAQIDADVPLREYGVDSIATSLLAERLSVLKGDTVLPTLLLEFPTVGALARALSATVPAASPPAPPATRRIDTPVAAVPGGALAERLLRARQVFDVSPPRAAVAPAPAPALAFAPEPPPAAAVAAPRPGQAAPAALPLVMRIVAEVLSLDDGELEPGVPLRDYGIDSVSMSLVTERLSIATSRALHPGLLLEHPTIGALAAWLDGGASRAAPAPAPTPTPPPAANPTAPHPATTGATPREPHDDWIAVIGRAARMPGSADLGAFWRHLAAGDDLVRDVPPDRVALPFSSVKGLADHTYSRWAGLIDDPWHFDPRFFGLNANDAMEMDPQQRVFLELVQHLWDDAGYAAAEIRGSATGVFVGANESNYARQLAQRRKFNGKAGVVNVIANMIPGRVSDFYDLRGPSLAAYTACSSSLVALYQAVLSLQRGDCDMAIAGGIELLLDDEWFVGFSNSQALSVDGRCKVFDESANGFVLGEGAGAVLLKPYDRAVADGDRIHAVVEAIGVNNDGATMGLTTPNMKAQQQLIGQVLRRARIAPESISYFEAHGTGTALGDPIEIRSATRAWREFTDASGWCALGSVKSNIGHTLSAAGMASLLKVVLSLEKRWLPPTLHCRRPHPKFEFESTPFQPLQQGREWHAPGGVRRAALSSFGFGGTNVHMVVREPLPAHANGRRASLPPTRFNRQAYRLAEQAPADVGSLLDRLFAGAGAGGASA